MNLFAEDTENLLKKYMAQDWAQALSYHLNADDFLQLREKIGALRRRSKVYPDQGDVFRALVYPFEKVKVIIIGQDPYHNGNADGLAFSCKKSLSPSLQQILQAIYKDEMQSIQAPLNKINMNMYIGNKNNHDLTYLAQQGVLLYNPTLTVDEGRPRSHKGVWNSFTKAVFQALNTKKYLVWMLWGTDARDAVNSAIPSPNVNHLYLQEMHPAAASHQGTTWTCNHFNIANKWLEEKGLTSIEWLQR